jgi:hypothetical protein
VTRTEVLAHRSCTGLMLNPHARKLMAKWSPEYLIRCIVIVMRSSYPIAVQAHHRTAPLSTGNSLTASSNLLLMQEHHKQPLSASITAISDWVLASEQLQPWREHILLSTTTLWMVCLQGCWPGPVSPRIFAQSLGTFFTTAVVQLHCH